MDGDAGRKHALTELAEQETGLTRDGGAVDGGNEVAEQRGGDTRVEQDRHAAGFDLGRADASGGAFAGAAADRLGVLQVRKVAGAMVGIVPLHGAALARDDAGRGAVPGRAVGARETAGGGEGHGRGGSGCRAAVAVGHAGHRAGRLLGGEGPGAEIGGGRFGRIEGVEVGSITREQQLGGGEAGIGVLRRFPRHGDGALHQFG